MKRLAILGAGSWGTALASILAPRFDSVRLWARRAELAASIQNTRYNPDYLPGISMPANVSVHADLAEALHRADLALCALPSHTVRGIFSAAVHDPGLPIVSATKGVESGTLLRMSEVIAQASGSRRIAVLSGPSFAWEAAAGQPTALVAASAVPDFAEAVQARFSSAAFRVYSSADPIGVELAGAYKNVVAIGAGVCHGLGLGHNALSALITRGLAEMTRLAEKMGGKAPTLAGLAGLGDLVLTCTGGLSRNRKVGEELARGRSVSEIASEMRMVAEGIKTTHSILELGRLHHVELPIACQMDAVLSSARKPQEAIGLLMERTLKNEW
jgi:glycerol-3-phosphate dehydrogenase (NAD(P)+)